MGNRPLLTHTSRWNRQILMVIFFRADDNFNGCWQSDFIYKLPNAWQQIAWQTGIEYSKFQSSTSLALYLIASLWYLDFYGTRLEESVSHIWIVIKNYLLHFPSNTNMIFNATNTNESSRIVRANEWSAGKLGRISKYRKSTTLFL